MNPTFSGADGAATAELQDKLWADFSKKLEDGLLDAENNIMTYNADVTGGFEVSQVILVVGLAVILVHLPTGKLVADFWLHGDDYFNEHNGKHRFALSTLCRSDTHVFTRCTRSI
jgi:hypothetical protein